MVSKIVPISTDGAKESLINSNEMLNFITADQAGVMDVFIDAELKQNSKLFVHGIQSSISPSREVFWETHLFDYHGKGERMWLFFCPGDSTITK